MSTVFFVLLALLIVAVTGVAYFHRAATPGPQGDVDGFSDAMFGSALVAAVVLVGAVVGSGLTWWVA